MALLAFLLLWRAVQGFEVLDVGVPRTGTQTMATALEMLGYRTLHTGYNFSLRPALCEYIFANGSLQAALDVLEDFDAACDEPMDLFYEEVMEAYPHAKFVLTISDPETWYESYINLHEGNKQKQKMYSFLNRIPGLKVKTTASPRTPDPDFMLQCRGAHYFGCDFNNYADPEVKARCLDGYNGHNARVQQTIPADRLLVFNLSDGWGPLVDFLEKPMPDEAFPYTDKFHEHPEASEVTSFLQQGLHLHDPEEL